MLKCLSLEYNLFNRHNYFFRLEKNRPSFLYLFTPFLDFFSVIIIINVTITHYQHPHYNASNDNNVDEIKTFFFKLKE